MTKQGALKIIFILSFAGILFSGYLSYRELFMGSCDNLLVKCAENTGPILGLPACVYGLVMYVTVFVVALLGYKSKNN